MSRSTRLDIGPGLSFGTDVITEVIDVIAKRGSGKTYAATKLAEGMLMIGAQVVVIDPVGNWYGLRLGANGKSEGGLDITILGGRNGDIPLEFTAGRLIAKTIVDSGRSMILDVSMLSKSQQRKFVTDFSIALLEYRQRDPGAMHIFWEEAYRFMPQKLSKGSKNELLEATEELVTMGRNFGIGGTIICQRSAQISKTALTQASILMAMNTTGLADRKIIEAWIDYHSIESKRLDLANLAKGQAYVWWPEEFGIKLVTVAKKRTYDASSTPKFGEKSRRRKLKAIDLDALQVSMAATIEKAAKEDPRLLNRRIAELEAQIASLQVESLSKEQTSMTARMIENTDLDNLERLASEFTECIASMGKTPAPARSAGKTSPLPSRPPPLITARRGSLFPQEGQKIAAGAMRMLRGLAAVHPGGLTKKQVGLAARMKSTSGTFSSYWSKLNVSGFISESGGRWFISAAGMDHLGEDIPTQPDTPEEKLEFWCERLGGKPREMLRYMFNNYGQWFTKEELGSAVGLVYTSGTFSSYLSSLTANNLAVRSGAQYSVNDDLFHS